MRLIFTLLSTILLYINTANAIDENKIGLSPLAIAHPRFNCNSFLNSLKNQNIINIAWLYNTFGRNYSCLNRALNDSRLQYIETHLLNEPGHRNNRLENHEFLKKYTVKQWNRLLIRKDQRLKDRFFSYSIPVKKIIENRNPNSICMISPGLESNVSNRAGKILIEWTREIFPDCLTVWNPIKPTKFANSANADFIEQHSTDPKLEPPCIVNLDGTDISFPERISPNKKFYTIGKKNWIESTKIGSFFKKYEKCEIVFLWVSEYNCIDIERKPTSFIPPRKRLCNQNKVNLLIEKLLK